MRHIWMGVMPAAGTTRVLVMDGPNTLLKARLPADPGNPRALGTLCEAMALWCERRVHVALGAGHPDAFCATTQWLETFDAVSGENLLYEVDWVRTLRRPRERRERIEGMGDFRDVRQLALFEVLR
jgi:hypothetical protein